MPRDAALSDQNVASAADTATRSFARRLMEGRLDLIGTDFAAGWANEGDRPVRVELRLGDAAIAVAVADLFRADLQPRRDGHCAFNMKLPPLRDAIGALARGGLRAVAIGAHGTEHDLSAAHHLLPGEVLASSDMLFGRRDCASVLADLRLLAMEMANAPYRSVFASQLCDLLRVHFPPQQRPADFDRTAAELAELAGRDAAAAHYRRPRQPRAARAIEMRWQSVDVTASYACLDDLAAPPPPRVRCESASFISGDSDGGYLSTDRGLTRFEDPQAGFTSLWVGVEGFGGSGWTRHAPDAPMPAAMRLYLIDFEQLRRVADGGGVLVIDQSAEGSNAQPGWIDILNDTLADFGLSADQALLVNQNHAFLATSAGGSAQFRATTAQTYFLRGASVFTAMFPDEAAAAMHIEATLEHRRNTASARKFTCLNFTPRWVRWAVALSLFERGHADDGFFSFPGTQSAKPTERLHPAAMLPPLARREAMIGAYDGFVARCPFIVDVDGRSGAAPDFVFPQHAARESFLHIVTETEMSAGEVLRVTEKILKPIVALQPFIIFGNERSLALLHGMGFRTFGALFDESYDRVPSYVERFDAVEGVMLDLLSRDTAGLRALADQAAPICIHNFLHLVFAWPTLIRHGMMRRLMRQVATLACREAPEG